MDLLYNWICIHEFVYTRSSWKKMQEIQIRIKKKIWICRESPFTVHFYLFRPFILTPQLEGLKTVHLNVSRPFSLDPLDRSFLNIRTVHFKPIWIVYCYAWPPISSFKTVQFNFSVPKAVYLMLNFTTGRFLVSFGRIYIITSIWFWHIEY